MTNGPLLDDPETVLLFTGLSGRNDDICGNVVLEELEEGGEDDEDVEGVVVLVMVDFECKDEFDVVLGLGTVRVTLLD